MGKCGEHDIDHRDTEDSEIEMALVKRGSCASCSVFSGAPWWTTGRQNAKRSQSRGGAGKS